MISFHPDGAIISDSLASLNHTDEVFISILTIYELEYGYANAPDEKKSIIRKKIKEAISYK